MDIGKSIALVLDFPRKSQKITNLSTHFMKILEQKFTYFE
jgi:hypothetical protein